MHLEEIWDDLKSSLWFRPALWVIGLGALAVALVVLDHNLQIDFLAAMWFFGGSADGARTILGAVATSMLTATTVAFSILMVAVVQTANAYSPRTLGEYLRDRANQHVMGLLVGVFVYSLLVLRAIDTADSSAPFVPSLAVNVGLLLAIAATGAFVFFINHAAHSISVGNVILLSLGEIEGLIEGGEIFPENLGKPWPGPLPAPLPDGQAATLHADVGGYVTRIDGAALLALLREKDAVALLAPGIGDYLMPGSLVMTLWPQRVLDEEMEKALREVIRLDKERSLPEDLLFGFRQLSDIAVRALSPGINDPSTALHCIDALGLAVRKLSLHGPVCNYRCDEEGYLRLIAHSPDFTKVLATAFSQIRYYGSGDVDTTLRLMEVYGELAALTERAAEREALWQHVVLLMETADQNITVPGDRALLNQHLREVAKPFDRDLSSCLLVEGR